MYCPMQLDCKVMTGVIHNCPNLSECLRNSPLRRVEALRLYFQNMGVQEDSDHRSIYMDVCSSSPTPTSPYSTGVIYNRDYQTRDQILFGEDIDWEREIGGMKRFDALTPAQLQQLVDGGFVHPRDRHNQAPEIATVLEFAQEQMRYDLSIVFEGYAIYHLRDDYRVSIDGIILQGRLVEQTLAAFQNLACHADEQTIESNYLRAWWD